MTVDLDAARRFLTMLDPAACGFTFQTFDDKNKKRLVDRTGRDGKPRKVDPLAKILHGELDAVAPRLIELSRAGAGVYLCVNETDLRGRTAHNVTRVRAIFADLDGAPLENLKRFGLKPAGIVVSSQGRYHAYWPVEGVELAQFRDLQQRLARVLESDKSVIDLPRVLRLPGFAHQKAEPFMVMARYGVRRVYSRDEIVAALDEAERRLGLPKEGESETPRAAAHRQGDAPSAPRSGVRLSLTEQLAKGDHARAPINKVNVALVMQMLNALPDCASADYYTWLRVGFALHDFEPGAVGLTLYKKFSQRDPEKYEATDFDRVWASFDRGYRDDGITIGWLVHEAQQHGWVWPCHWDRTTPSAA